MYFYLLNMVLVFLPQCIYTQNFPEYWTGKIATNLNGTMANLVPLKITSSEKEYNINASKYDKYVVDSIKIANVSIPTSAYYPSNSPPVNQSGTIHKVQLVFGFLTYLEVLDEFNYDGNKTVPVKICTSWYDWNKLQSLNHTPGFLAEAVASGNILNMTMYLPWSSLDAATSAKVNQGKTWEIEEYLCYYDGISAKIINGKCTIPYTSIIHHYMRMWSPDKLSRRAINGNRKRVTNNKYFQQFPCGPPPLPTEDNPEPEKPMDCEDGQEEIEYVDVKEAILDDTRKWYRFDTVPAALGYAGNTTFGYNSTKRIYDVNFTMMFNNWTFDFPQGLLYNYQDLSLEFSKFKMEIYYWLKDPEQKPERTIPASFYIMLFVMIGPSAVLLLTILLLVLTCSKKTFFLPVWDNWVERRKSRIKMSEESARQQKNVKEIEKFRKRNETIIHTTIMENSHDYEYKAE